MSPDNTKEAFVKLPNNTDDECWKRLAKCGLGNIMVCKLLVISCWLQLVNLIPGILYLLFVFNIILLAYCSYNYVISM
jgi:hypothetical protein